jgi:antirestriction protein ArdC
MFFMKFFMKEKKQDSVAFRTKYSQEVRDIFVDDLAQRMMNVSDRISKGEKLPSFDMPFSPVTGKEFQGANQTQLVMAGLERGYKDNRWASYEQFGKLSEDYPEMNLRLPKGERGVVLLESREASYITGKNGEREWLSSTRKEEIEQMRAAGEVVPEINTVVLFSAKTYFNAEQITGFPPKENPKPALSAEERDAVIDGVIASAGVKVQENSRSQARFRETTHDAANDILNMAPSDTFASHDQYQATKLRGFFHATGHENRERRFNAEGATIKDVAYEAMRGEIFSMFAAAKYGLPMPKGFSAEKVASRWDQKFSNDNRAHYEAFLAAADASKIFAVLNQFERGEQPKAGWFPPKEDWPALNDGQKAQAVAPAAAPVSEESPPPVSLKVQTAAPVSEESSHVSLNAGDPVQRGMVILQDPMLLDRALRQDPTCITQITQLCESLSAILHMESQSQAFAAQQLQDTAPPPAPPQRAQSSGMRM